MGIAHGILLGMGYIIAVSKTCQIIDDHAICENRRQEIREWKKELKRKIHIIQLSRDISENDHEIYVDESR